MKTAYRGAPQRPGEPDAGKLLNGPAAGSRQRVLMLRLLVQLRQDAGLAQAALARRLAITQSEVSKYERGERDLDLLRLRAWLHALEIEFPAFVAALDAQLEGHERAFAG